jgi:uncharacterized membrane protein
MTNRAKNWILRTYLYWAHYIEVGKKFCLLIRYVSWPVKFIFLLLYSDVTKWGTCKFMLLLTNCKWKQDRHTYRQISWSVAGIKTCKCSVQWLTTLRVALMSWLLQCHQTKSLLKSVKSEFPNVFTWSLDYSRVVSALNTFRFPLQNSELRTAVLCCWAVV